MWTGHLAAAGIRYQYYIRAYDLAGNKSAKSNIVMAELPLEVALPDETKKPIAPPSFLKATGAAKAPVISAATEEVAS